MSGPEDFVSFGDYLGLNDEAGQAMLKRTMAEQSPGMGIDRLRQLSEAHYNQAGDVGIGGDAAYQRTGDALKKGMASYGEFMKGMNDPAARQALMEKTYGKGATSAFDSALAGSNSTANEQAQFDSAQRDINSQSQNADIRRDYWKKNESDFQEGQKRDNARRQANYDNAKKIEAQNREKAENKRIDDYGKLRYGNNYNPTASSGPFGDFNPFGVFGYQTNRSRMKGEMDEGAKQDAIRRKRAAQNASGGPVDPGTGSSTGFGGYDPRDPSTWNK